MTAREVLDCIKNQLAAATPGPWEWDNEIRRGLYAPAASTPVLGCSALLHPGKADSAFIADAPATVARLTAALEAVLGLHNPIPCEPECCSGQLCETCIHDWPCPTVAAIEGALKEGQ